MIRLMLLILLISANCMKMNCEEETSTTGYASEVLEKTEILSTDPELLQSKAADTEAENDESKGIEDFEEIRVSRSSSNLSTLDETQFDDASTVHSTEAFLAEKSAPDETVADKDGQVEEEIKEPLSRTDSAEDLEEKTKSTEKAEKQLEKLAETSRSAPENEDRKAEDLLEASAESKVSDNEKASSKVDESDRSSEVKEINEESDDSGLDEGLKTRRMFSGSDFIVIDSKTRPDITTDAVKPEGKIAFDQNLNTYNNYNEFGTDSNIKLTDSSRTEPTPVSVTIMPTATRVANQEIFNQQYYPKFYPRPELNINFPNVNSAFQGPRDLPIYLKIKQDELQPKNQFIGDLNAQIKISEENKYSNTRNQQYQQSQKILDTRGTVTNKEFQNLRVETRAQAPQYYQNQMPTDVQSYIRNKQLTNLNQNSRAQAQQFYQNQEKINSNYENYGNINQESQNQMQSVVNSKMPLNNGQSNQYPLYGQSQGIIDSKINLEYRPPGSGSLRNLFSYDQLPNLQRLNTPVKIIPKNIRILFQKLASASEFPRNLQTNVYNNNNIRTTVY